MEQRLDALTKVVDAASRSGSLPPVPQIGQPALDEWADNVWQAVLGSQTATHFPRDELTKLSDVYAKMAGLRTFNQEELLTWANLSAIAGPGRRLDPASETALRAALSQARYYSRIMAVGAGQQASEIESLNPPFSQDVRKGIDSILHRPLADFEICKPLATAVPALYGQAPYSEYLGYVRDFQKHPPFTQNGK